MAKRIEIDDEAFAADWATGETITNIAYKYQISSTTVSTHVERLGLPERKARKTRKDASPLDLDQNAGSWVRNPKTGVQTWQKASVDA